MKIKRFLSLAVALAMVLSIVPAMSLTASAATSASKTSSMTIEEWGTYAENVFTYPQTGQGDAKLSTYYEGWSSSWNGTNFTSGTININSFWNSYQVYGAAGTTDTVTMPGYGAGKDFVIMEFMHSRSTVDYKHEFAIKDINGKIIETGRIARGVEPSGLSLGYTETFLANSPNPSATVGTKSSNAYDSGTRLVFVNNNDNTYSVFAYTAGDAVTSQVGESAYHSTYQPSWESSKWLKTYSATYSGQFNGLGSIDYAIPSTKDTWANHRVNFLRIYAGDIPAGAKEIVARYTVNGEAVKTEPKIIDTAVTNEAEFPAYGYSANGTNVMYYTEGASLSENGEIALEAVANNGAYKTGDMLVNNGTPYVVKSDNLIPNGDFSYGLAGWYAGDGNVAASANFRTDGDGTVTKISGTGNQNKEGSIYRAWKVEPNKTYIYTYTSTGGGQYHKNSLGETFKATGADGSRILFEGVAGTNTNVFTTGANENYLIASYRWLGDNTDTFGNFGLYEIAEAEVAVTETVASVDAIAGVTVIGDTAVILPSTVEVTGSLGSVVDATIAWTNAPESYEVGTTTVNGVATVQFGEQEATTTEVSTTVTVLEETFTIDDSDSTNGQPGNVVYFPVEITDEFNMEFDYTVNQVKNVSLQLGYNGTIFGNGALGISPNNGVLAATGGNKAGTSEGVTLVSTVNAGDSFHMFLTADASDDTYTLTVTTADGTIVTTGEKGFRTAHDAINTITLLTNGGGDAGDITVSNIKVNSTVTKTEYTFVTTKDGVTETTTGLYWTAEEAEATVEEIEGYHVDVTVEGTTITVVYTNMTVVTEEIASVAEIEDITVFVSDEIVLPETVKVTGTFDTVVDAPITWNAPEEFEAGATTVDGTIEVKFSETADILVHDVSINVTVIDEFTLGTVESYGAQPGHIVEFPVKIKNGFTMEFDYTINTVADASLQMGGDAGKRFGDGALGISPNGGNLAARGEGNPMLVEGVAAGETYHMILQMNAATDTYTLYVEKADGTVVTATEGFRKAQEYIDAITVLLNGNNIDNKGTIVVSDIVVNTKNVELCTVTVDGVEKKVIKGRSYKADMAGAIFDDAGVMYASENDKIEVLVENDMTLTTKALGLEMVGGAQVRIGSADLEEGKKLDATADSGLRFLATADYSDTLIAEDNVEFGIKVTAEASDNVAYIEAKNFQDENNNVFSAAITNLKESNYNRNYTATAYAKVNGVEITTGSVTRSIYQVSAGIMKNGKADADNAAYTVDGVVKNVLNAYVNQTGIRLTVNANDGISVEENKYTGDVFFTVESVSDGDDGWNVTITPDESWGTPAEIAEWWTDYVRFNNNNSIAKGYISANYYVDGEPVFVHDDGSLTFNFDTTDDGTGGFDGPWVPIG